MPQKQVQSHTTAQQLERVNVPFLSNGRLVCQGSAATLRQGPLNRDLQPKDQVIKQSPKPCPEPQVPLYQPTVGRHIPTMAWYFAFREGASARPFSTWAPYAD